MAALARLGGRYAQIANAGTGPGLRGLVDMHMHPAAQLGFGRQLFYGDTDGDPNQGYQDCGPFHSDPLNNAHGNFYRHELVDVLGGQDPAPGWSHERQGFPSLVSWPSWHDRLHQQARVEYLERAWQGGLRAVVALAVSSAVLADAGETSGPYDDRTLADDQIQAIKDVCSRHAFLQVVRSAAEYRATRSTRRTPGRASTRTRTRTWSGRRSAGSTRRACGICSRCT